MASFRFSSLLKLLDPEIRAKNLQWLAGGPRRSQDGKRPRMPDPVRDRLLALGNYITFRDVASGHFRHFDYSCRSSGMGCTGR
jgi:hypothetical protein